MDPITVGIIGIVVMVGLLFTGLPVGFTMAVTGIVGCTYLISFESALAVMINDISGFFMSYDLTVIPMFIFMGAIAFEAGMSQRLYACANKFLAFLPGGLAIATIGACAAFAAICGSTNATAAAMGTVAIPEMKKYKYADKLSCGVVAAAGTLGILIPPSGIFIIYGILTETSIGKLFMAGIVPGIILSLMLMAVVIIWVTIDPTLGPRGQSSTFKEKLKTLPGVVEMFVLFLVVIGGLFLGLFTPTEAGAVGSSGCVVIALITRSLTWKGFTAAVDSSFRLSCMILIIVTGATIFGRFLAVSRIPFEIAGWTAGLPFPPVVTMGIIIFIYFIGGFFMDAFALILLTIPIFFPVVIQLGYDPVWFGVIIVLVVEMGVITPPVGINVYVIGAIAKDVPLQTIFRGIFPLLCAIMACTALLVAFPQICLWLPNIMK